ncbi:MAG: hypothetical protein KF753_05345 [Caldilineaceae bacterium]|nr:hypothetical protein [Caldilineaceae bacterium]
MNISNSQSTWPGRLAVVSLLVLLFALSSFAWLDSRAADAKTPTIPDAASDAVSVTVSGDLSQRQLLINGRVVWQRAGSHLGNPAISPDGRLLAISVVPTGTETDGYAQTMLFSLADGRQVATTSGHSPVWQSDGKSLALESRKGRLVYDLSRGRALAEPTEIEAQSTIPAIPIGNSSAPDYPQFIRVAHHPENTCRNVADWQVDTIPFEEYVARSVPAEVPVHWAIDALAAQAVAARTYAWYQIRQNRPNYDVTDWANFQMMCNDRYPASDQAVAMTTGQYLSFQGDSIHRPIIAMYSAMNSHPTLDNLSVPYLRAVPDLTGLGEERWGHGYGLSQWGAARRAKAGQSYRQILGHYFTSVHLQNALDPTQPIAGLLGPTQNGYLPPGGLRWGALTSFALPGGKVVLSSSGGLTRTLHVTTTQTISYTSVITHSSGLTETVILTDTATVTQTSYATAPVTLPGSGVWQQPLDLADDTQVVASLYQNDILQESVRLWVDRTPPSTPGLTLPGSSDSQTITLHTITPSGATLGLSNHWFWEGESLSASKDSSSVVADHTASAGMAREARPGIHRPGDWYGPYTAVLPAGASYRAIFRMRIGEHPVQSANGVLPDDPIARLDVTDQMGDLRLGLRDIWASDFAAPGRYQDIAVDFHIFTPAQGIEFRVKWQGEVTLALDRVWVWQLQKGEGQQNRAWQLNGSGEPSVQAISFDGAGNASQPVSVTVKMVDDAPPIFGTVSGPVGWQTELPITMTTTVYDRVSGLDSNSGRLFLNDQSRPARLENPDNPWAEQRLTAVLDDAETPLADGIYQARFRVADRTGTSQDSPTFAVQVDRTPPEMRAGTIQASGEPILSAHGWFAGPVQVKIDASDATSGLAGVAYVLDDAPFALYSQPISLTSQGWHVVRYWAQDMAGNYRYSQYFEVGVDMTAPNVWARLSATGTAEGSDETPKEALATWGGSDPLSGLDGYRVELRRNGGDWTRLLPDGEGATSETSLPIALAEEETVEIRVQAQDRAGNASAWVVVPLTSTRELFLPTIGGRP